MTVHRTHARHGPGPGRAHTNRPSEDQTYSAGGPLLEAVNTGRIDMARVLLAHGADPNANVFTSGSPTYAAYRCGSPRVSALTRP